MQFTSELGDRSQLRNLDDFSNFDNFVNPPAEFGKIFLRKTVVLNDNDE